MTLSWWHVGGLLMALVQAGYLLINQHYKLEPRLLMLWRGFGVLALLLPAVIILHPPGAPLFYLYAGLAGVGVALFDRLLFKACAERGAGVTSRLLSLSIPVAFLLWLALHPDHLETLNDRPFIALLPLALLGSVGSAMMLRRDPVSRGALLALAPVCLLGGCIDVLNKSAMTQASGLNAVLTYGCITGTVTGIINLFWPDTNAPPRQLHRLFAPGVIAGGASAVLVVTLFMLLKTTSLADAPNPSFVSALGLMAPVWVLLWNRWHRISDRSSLWAGFGCVISALLLVLATL